MSTGTNIDTENGTISTKTSAGTSGGSAISNSGGSFVGGMDEWNADLALHVINFLSVADASRLATTSKRYYYLVSGYRRMRGSEVVASSSYQPRHEEDDDDDDDDDNNNEHGGGDGRRRRRSQRRGITRPQRYTEDADEEDDDSRHLSTREMFRDALNRFQSVPNLLLAYANEEGKEDLFDALPSLVPNRETIILGTVSDHVQSSLPIPQSIRHRRHRHKVEHKSKASVMLLHLHNTRIKPFCFSIETTLDYFASFKKFADELCSTQREGDDNNGTEDASNNSRMIEWKVFIVHATEDTYNHLVESFLNLLNSRFPNSVAVGGICSSGYVSYPVKEIYQQTEEDPTNGEEKVEHTRNDLSKLSRKDLLCMARSMGSSEQATDQMRKKDLVNHVYHLLHSDNHKLCDVAPGIFGVALGFHQHVARETGEDGHHVGHADTLQHRTLVSFGGRSLTSDRRSDATTAENRRTAASSALSVRPSSSAPDLVVHEVECLHPGDHGYHHLSAMIRGQDENDECYEASRGNSSLYLIRRIRNQATGTTYTPTELLNLYRENNVDWVGLKLPGRKEDGYELFEMRLLSNAFAFELNHVHDGNDGNSAAGGNPIAGVCTASLVNAGIDLFGLDRDASTDDMKRRMKLLKEHHRRNGGGETILGAIMISCTIRGPDMDFMGEAMFDAGKFAEFFPSVPCLGYYANGEIGPRAMVRDAGHNSNNNHDDVHEGRSALQGYTGIFLLFVAPARGALTRAAVGIDDSASSVDDFVRRRLRIGKQSAIGPDAGSNSSTLGSNKKQKVSN